MAHRGKEQRLLAAFFGLLLLATVATAQTRDDERDSLRTLEPFSVIIEALHSDADEIGLDRDALKREALYRLQRANIPMADPNEREIDPRQPYLYVNCNVVYVPQIEAASFSIDVELHQWATLQDEQQMLVTTWARSYLGVQPRGAAGARVRAELGTLVEQFIQDFLDAQLDRA